MSDHTPRFYGWEAKVRQSFARQEAMKSIGVTIADLVPGKVTLHMPFDRRFSQQHGFIHAGIITAALDSSCGYAAHSLMAEDDAVLSVEFKTNLLAPAEGEMFVFKSEVVKSGRTLSVATATAYSVTAGREKAIATMTATLMAVRDRPDVSEGQ